MKELIEELREYDVDYPAFELMDKAASAIEILLSEKKQEICTFDAVDSLRGRLAKYEDAEGNPVSTISEQAREIERLQLNCNALDDQNDRIYAELAALKQPISDERVLRDEELWVIRNRVALHEIRLHDDSVTICVKHGRAIEQAVLARQSANAVVMPERASENEGNAYSVMQAMARNKALDEVARLNPSRGVLSQPDQREGVIVPREFLQDLLTTIDSNGYAADEVETVDELRALLAGGDK